MVGSMGKSRGLRERLRVTLECGELDQIVELLLLYITTLNASEDPATRQHTKQRILLSRGASLGLSTFVYRWTDHYSRCLPIRVRAGYSKSR